MIPEWQTQFQWLYAQVVAKAWADDKFRSKLLENPKKVLSDHGFSFPETFTVRLVPGASGTTLELPLPEKPSGLHAEDLEKSLHHLHTDFSST